MGTAATTAAAATNDLLAVVDWEQVTEVGDAEVDVDLSMFQITPLLSMKPHLLAMSPLQALMMDSVVVAALKALVLQLIVPIPVELRLPSIMSPLKSKYL